MSNYKDNWSAFCKSFGLVGAYAIIDDLVAHRIVEVDECDEFEWFVGPLCRVAQVAFGGALLVVMYVLLVG